MFSISFVCAAAKNTKDIIRTIHHVKQTDRIKRLIGCFGVIWTTNLTVTKRSLQGRLQPSYTKIERDARVSRNFDIAVRGTECSTSQRSRFQM